VLPRPRIRIPLGLAAAIVLMLYAIRSAMRGFDWRLDLPDAIVLVAFIVVLGVVAYLRSTRADDDEGSYSADDADPAANGESGSTAE
jgi:hypothetical protein